MTLIGGPVGETAAPYLTPAIERELQARALVVPIAAARIDPGRLGEHVGAIGAAALALECSPWLFAK
jgi:hypothetical protein